MHSKFPDGLNSLSCFPRWHLYNTGGHKPVSWLPVRGFPPAAAAAAASFSPVRSGVFLSGSSPAGREFFFFVFFSFLFFPTEELTRSWWRKLTGTRSLSWFTARYLSLLVFFLLLLLLFLLAFLQQCVGRRSAHSRERGTKKKKREEVAVYLHHIPFPKRRRRRRRKEEEEEGSPCPLSVWHLRTWGKSAAEPYEGTYRGNTFSQRFHLFHSHNLWDVVLQGPVILFKYFYATWYFYCKYYSTILILLRFRAFIAHNQKSK